MNSPHTKNQKSVVLYFQLHQPERLQSVNFFDIAGSPHYFNDALNQAIVRRVAADCYLPAAELLLKLIREFPAIKVTFSLSGLVVEQLRKFAPEVLDCFRRLAKTGSVEFLGETYYHSLSSLISGEEFELQILQHAELMLAEFGVRPRIFRNTELIYRDDIGKRIAMMGFSGVFTEGHESVLGKRTPHALYTHPEHDDLRIFVRNYRLSDDIAFRFREGGKSLTVDRYMSWLDGIPEGENIVCLAMDFETFGEHHKRETGIFDFLGGLLTKLAKSTRYQMMLPTEAAGRVKPAGPLRVEKHLSWADLERDLSAWLENDMQKDAFNSIMKLESEVKNLGDKTLLAHWRTLQTSDHFYYMSLKTDSDGSVHSYFSPFPSSYEAFINYMNVVTHLTHRINEEKDKPKIEDRDLSSWEAERQQTKVSTPVWAMNLESVPHLNVPGTKD